MQEIYIEVGASKLKDNNKIFALVFLKYSVVKMIRITNTQYRKDYRKKRN